MYYKPLIFFFWIFFLIRPLASQIQPTYRNPRDDYDNNNDGNNDYDDEEEDDLLTLSPKHVVHEHCLSGGLFAPQTQPLSRMQLN